MEIVGKTNIDFLGMRRVAFIASSVLVLLGVLAAVQIARGHANLGIDFAGGTSVQVLFERRVDLGEVRRVLAAGGFGNSELQQFVGGRRLFIRVKASGDSVAGTGSRIEETLRQGFAATIATFHDVLVVLGIFYLLGKEITLLIITALLTLAGYSLTDTVVVFDRIRENFRARRKGSLADIINVSINEVLSRTIMTSVTTALAILAIHLLGGEVLRDFSLALLLGILVGTYSSVFVATAIVYEWRVRVRRAGVGMKKQAQSLH
jgi:preprotein translocase subunit SecF